MVEESIPPTRNYKDPLQIQSQKALVSSKKTILQTTIASTWVLVPLVSDNPGIFSAFPDTGKLNKYG